MVLELVEAQRRHDITAGYQPVGKVGLISSATGDYRDLAMVATGLVDLGVAIGISSLRMDRMPEVLIDCMVRSGVRSCTVAPEAGSERLRQLIRKEMSEAVILTGVEMLLAKGMRDLKLYSMIGLPTETDEDLHELLSLVFKITYRKFKRPLPPPAALPACRPAAGAARPAHDATNAPLATQPDNGRCTISAISPPVARWTCW